MTDQIEEALKAAAVVFDELERHDWPQSERDEYYGEPGSCPVEFTAAKQLVTEAIADGGWIKVDDLLPPECEEILLYSENKFGVRQGEYSKGQWYDIFGNSAGRVTHWKPLTPPSQTE